MKNVFCKAPTFAVVPQGPNSPKGPLFKRASRQGCLGPKSVPVKASCNTSDCRKKACRPFSWAQKNEGWAMGIQKLQPPRLGDILDLGNKTIHNLDNCLAKWSQNGFFHTNSVRRIHFLAPENILDVHLSRSAKPQIISPNKTNGLENSWAQISKKQNNMSGGWVQKAKQVHFGPES